jgi:hypothetical protein
MINEQIGDNLYFGLDFDISPNEPFTQVLVGAKRNNASISQAVNR